MNEEIPSRRWFSTPYLKNDRFTSFVHRCILLLEIGKKSMKMLWDMIYVFSHICAGCWLPRF